MPQQRLASSASFASGFVKAIVLSFPLRNIFLRHKSVLLKEVTVAKYLLFQSTEQTTRRQWVHSSYLRFPSLALRTSPPRLCLWPRHTACQLSSFFLFTSFCKYQPEQDIDPVSICTTRKVRITFLQPISTCYYFITGIPILRLRPREFQNAIVLLQHEMRKSSNSHHFA